MLRRNGGRVIGGVAGGLADHLDVDVFRVRVVFVLLGALAGAGVAAYVLLWFLCPIGDDTDRSSPAERRQAYGLALVGMVVSLLVGIAAAGTPLANLLPFLVVLVGAGVVWREFDAPVTSRGTWRTWARLAGGAAAVVGGLAVVVLVGDPDVGRLSTTLLAVGVTLAGVVMLTVPLWMRLWRALGEERAARIRDAEREEIASHLHDSVLQTLALIQKKAAKPDEVVRLARSQERELRGWLFGDPAQHGSSLAATLTSVCGEVEDDYGIEVDVITVGDLSPDDEPGAEQRRRWAGLASAAREALINAAKHSGQRKVSVYCEVTDDEVEVFIRDRGVGFDPDTVDTDRQGLVRSVRGRMDRFGGSATIDSAPGRGTNVVLKMPRNPDDRAGVDDDVAVAAPAAQQEGGR